MHRYCVFAKHFYLLLPILFCMSHKINCQVTKCCPEQTALNIDSDYFCEPAVNRTNWDAYNLPTSSVTNCSEFRNVLNGSEMYIELNGCIDKDSSGQYVALSCSQHLQDSTTGVHFLNKCCPIGQSYDQSQHFCIKDRNVHARFNQVFGKTAIAFQHNVPNCSVDEVFVEYFSTLHNIQFDGSNLKVNGNSLISDKFCIEDLVNIDSIGINGSESHIIIRSCRSHSVCNQQIPCMRRCCKADQVMEPRAEGYKICQYHPYKMNLQPTFYNVTFPLDDSQKQVYVKGMVDFMCSHTIYILNNAHSEQSHYKVNVILLVCLLIL